MQPNATRIVFLRPGSPAIKRILRESSGDFPMRSETNHPHSLPLNSEVRRSLVADDGRTYSGRTTCLFRRRLSSDYDRFTSIYLRLLFILAGNSFYISTETSPEFNKATRKQIRTSNKPSTPSGGGVELMAGINRVERREKRQAVANTWTRPIDSLKRGE